MILYRQAKCRFSIVMLIGGTMLINNYSRDIRILVHKTGLDIINLANKINASEKSIYKWMNGTSLPNCGHLLALISLANLNEGQN